jgi:hypothetical protein
MNTTVLIIPRGYPGYVQVLDVSYDKIIKTSFLGVRKLTVILTKQSTALASSV